ncbi:MAG: hypothetical protein LBQ41_01235 [Candidatus Ancillula sp.]|jgi:glycosidase|nr:hypothetical protein [Candidatus Ancillula sp.]
MNNVNRIFYQFFSLNYTVGELRAWGDFLEFMGYNSVYLTPIFKSTDHSYDTEDFRQVDPRIGTNSEFKQLVAEFRSRGISTVIDGVFNHVGRNFWAFTDVQQNGRNSKYWEWFKDLRMASEVSDDTCRSKQYFPDDTVDYEGWEGNFDLVLLNHECEDLVQYLMECARFWIDEFEIGGIRLDVAYSLPSDFVRSLRDTVGPDFYLLGEQIHGDYKRLLEAGLDSVTDYNLYKALWSSVLDDNLFEANWTLEKHQEEYDGRRLLTFVDNHDTDRVASRYTADDGVLNLDKLKKVYELLFLVPGDPSIFYGSEFALEDKCMRSIREDGAPDADKFIRAKISVPRPEQFSNELSEHIRSLIKTKKETPALWGWDYTKLEVQNQYLKFARGGEIFEFNLASRG